MARKKVDPAVMVMDYFKTAPIREAALVHGLCGAEVKARLEVMEVAETASMKAAVIAKPRKPRGPNKPKAPKPPVTDLE